MTRIYLIRHASAFDEKGEQADDSPLSDEGKMQSKLLAERFKTLSPCVIVSSPFKRALQSAEIVNKDHNLKIDIRDGLKELSWEFWPEVGHIHYDKIEGLIDQLEEAKRGKFLLDVQSASLKEIDNIYHDHKDTQVLAFTHGNFIRAVISGAMGATMRGFLSLIIDLTSVTILDYDSGNLSIVTMNDASHTYGKV